MEIGELVAVEIPETRMEDKCPFSHEKPNPTEKNELGGIGSTLGNNMAAGKGVHKTKPPFGGDFTTGDKEPDPRDRAEKLTHVFIKVKGVEVKLNDTPLPYPLTCAAHHLVPAQESLKEHKILKFICKDGEDQDFRNGGDAAPAAVPGSVVWGNVAYNVNGRQNGVWLPGNYAVGAGVNGVEVRRSRSDNKKRRTYTDDEAAKNWVNAVDLGEDEWQPLSVDPEETEGPQPGEALADALTNASFKDYALAGTNYNIDDGNPKWAYVKAAMDAAGGQFHDRHEPYSCKVIEYLDKMAETYEQLYDYASDENGCDECKKAARPDGAKASLLGPPYGIVGRLVTCSNFFKALVGHHTVTARNIYTSKWVKAWIDTRT